MQKIAGWSEIDDRAVAYARALAMDAVQKEVMATQELRCLWLQLLTLSFSAISFMIQMIHSG